MSPAKFPSDVAALDAQFDPEPDDGELGKVVHGVAPRGTRMVDRDEWSARDFDGIKLKGDDESPAIEAAIRYARQANKPLVFPEAPQIPVTQSLTNNADVGLPLLLKGAGRNQTTFIRNGFSAAIFKPLGAALTEVTKLSAEAAIGAATIKVESTSGMSKSMWLLLRDKTTGIEGTSSGGIASCSGEWVRVKAVLNSTEFTIYGRLRWTLTSGSDVRTFNGSTPRVELGDFAIDNSVPGESNTGFARGIYLENCVDPIISRVKISRLDANGIYLSRVLGGTVEQAHFFEMQNEEEPTSPYSIAVVNGCSGISVIGCRGRYGRHLVTTGGGGSTDIGVQDVEVWSCVVREYNGAAFDAHPGSRWVHFFNPVAIDCDSYGVQLRGPDMSVIEPQISGTPTGIYVVDGADRARISGGKIDRAEIGIAIRDSDDCTITNDVLIERPSKKGIYVEPVRSPYTGHMTKQNFESARITGNPSEGALVVSNENSGFKVGPRFRANDASVVFSGISRTPLSVGRVVHGSDKTVARPVGYDSIDWIGTVEPEHMAENDTLWKHE